MKNIIKLFIGLFFVFFTFTVNAQSTNNGVDWWIGKWSIIISGTPSGDSPMEIRFEKQDGKVVCLMPVNEKGEYKPVERLEINENEFTAYWVAAGYNVYLYMEKTKDGKIEGSMMDMFDAVGQREKEENKD